MATFPDFSAIYLSADKFTLEMIGISVFESNRDAKMSPHDLYLDCFLYQQFTTDKLVKILEGIPETQNVEAIFCRFPIDSYIGSLIRKLYPDKQGSLRRGSDYIVDLRADLNSYNRDRLDNLIKTFSFQYLDKRVVFSNPQFKSRFETAIKNRNQTDFEQSIIESTVLAYQATKFYYGNRKGSSGTWSF